VFAADRRLSQAGRPYGRRKKILHVAGKRAGVGYFGLAQVPLRTRKLYMDQWLSDNLPRLGGPSASLGELAKALASELNTAIPHSVRSAHVSGFHLAGLRSDGAPEFWFIRNVADDRTTLTGTYSEREDFQARDASALRPGSIQIYRNGDIRAHAGAWEQIDGSFGALLSLPAFFPGRGPVAYARWVKFKMETIAGFYRRFSRESIIGMPVDAFVVTPEGVRDV